MPQEEISSNRIKNILILTADAGFGHRSAANAISAALEETHPTECKVQIINPLHDKRVPPLLRNSGDDYDRLIRRMPRLYKLEYDVSDSTPTTAVVNSAVAVMLFEVMNDLIRRHQPDVVVTPYPLYQAPLASVFAFNQHDIPMLTVVTDLAPVHRTWFNKAADLCMVSMPAVRDQAIENGILPEKIAVTGIPVHPNLIREKRSSSEIRRELGWDPELKTLLAVGSKRVKNMTGILNALNHSGLPVQLVIAAGGDDVLYHQLQQMDWHTPVHLYNFVDNMPLLMHAADCILCKAGGLIVTESLACGLPILLTDVIEGQETSNMRYVVDGGAGEIARTPIDALEILFHWLTNDCELLVLRGENSRRLGYPHAAYDAAEFVYEASRVGSQIKTDRRFLDRIEKFMKSLQR